MPSSIRSTRALLAAFAALSGFLGFSNAQSVATTPVGAMTYSFPATTAVTTTYISVPLTNPTVYSGPTASSTSTTITFSGTPFTAGALSAAGSPFFARIATGAEAGRMVLITANTANTITVDVSDKSSQTTNLDTASFAVAAGDRVEIVVGDTLASFFGDNTASNPLTFVGAGILANADTISIYNKITAKFETYFFNTTAGYWRSSTVNANANNLVLYPEAAIGITRRASRPLVTLTTLGEVPVVAPATKTLGANGVVYVSTRYPVDRTLGQLTFNNWTKGTILGNSDTISIFNPTTAKFDTYFQRSADSQWRKSTATTVDASSTVIPAGSMIAILRRGTLATPATFVSTPLPYSL